MRPLFFSLSSLVLLSGCSLENAGFLSRKDSFSPPVTPVAVKNSDDASMKPRAPKASTCIAFADFRAQEANYPDRTPQQRQLLREEARKAYQQALTIEPNNMHAMVNMARLYCAMEDYDHAKETYTKAAKLFPKEGGIHFELGMLQARTKQWTPALENLSRALAQDPENRQFLNTYGFALTRAGKTEDGLKEFLKINEPAVAHYQVARMLVHLGDKQQARDYLTKALAQKPDYPDALALLQSLSNEDATSNPGT